jgi:N-6 DNA Methylase
MLSDYIKHLRDREYMSGVSRDNLRVKSTGEVFTPTPLVQEILAQLPNDVFADPSKTFLDPSCGDGQFLGEVLIRKMENGATFEQALSTIYGVDLMIDNVDLCRKRLLCGREDLRHIVEQNIYQADGLKFSYDFCPMSATRRKREEKLRRQVEKEKLKAQKEAQAKEIFDSMFKEEKPKKKLKTVVSVVSAQI